MRKVRLYIAGAIMVAAVAQGQEAITNYLYSTDIGSDLDISDPNTPGSMDAGAIYTPRGNPGSPLQWKDDDSPTPQWPGYPFANAPQPTPSEIGQQQGTDKYGDYFDLDAEDQLLDENVSPGQSTTKEALEHAGIYSIYNPVRLSYDDDGAPGWAKSGDVPVTAPPDDANEIHGTQISSPPPPLGPGTSTPLFDEDTLQLGPNPGGVGDDDDVDALDWHPLVEDPQGGFQARYFSPDHEANLGQDPGSIYLTLRNSGQNVTLAFDDVNNLGIPEDADVDAFEFVAIDDQWNEELNGSLQPGEWTAAAIFSVDEDDPDTPIDESGGLDPKVIYLTDLAGHYTVATGPYSNDIDALTVIPEPGVLALIGLFGGGMLFVRRFFLM